MRYIIIALNDLFFSALGFYLGLWYFKLFRDHSPKEGK
jgi:hypothetical protein